MPPSYVATSTISLVVVMAGVITTASASVQSLRGIRSLSTATFSTYHRRPAVTPPSRGFPFHRNTIKNARTRIPFSRFSAKTMRTMSVTTMEYDEANKEEGLNGSYEPSSFESEMYDWWERSGCFDPDANIISSSNGSNSADGGKHGGKSPYVLPIPPPNVKGRLHMGHGIFVALQDVLARFHRMKGRPVLWLPGKWKIVPFICVLIELRLCIRRRDRYKSGCIWHILFCSNVNKDKQKFFLLEVGRMVVKSKLR